MPLPRDAYYCGGELIPVFDDKERVNRGLAQRVCADGIVHEGYQPCVRVLKFAEERNLRRIG